MSPDAHLSTSYVGSPNATRTIVMLHGIYGWGRNWASIARQLVARRADYACVLVDLPHHGDSGPGAHGDTVRGAALDVAATLDRQHIGAAAILGHSFGGKVALAMAEDVWRDRPLQVWVIDSTPAPRAPSGSAWDLMRLIRRLPPTFPSREHFVRAATSEGWAAGVAQWMATNLERRGEVFAWRLDLDAVERQMADFVAADFWPSVESPAPGHVIHFIRASQSDVMSDDAVRRAERAGSGRVHVHHLEGGHWIHTERPADVVALLAREL